MTQAIHSNNAVPYTPLLSSRGQATGRMSYQEAMTQNSQADIAITTDEGDLVTISSYQGEGQAMSYDRWNSPLQQGMNFTASSIKIDSYSLSIQGDLSEEELLDIENLLAELSVIAGDFFSGDTDQAMAGAMNLGDMGSLAELSATFSYSASWSASQLTEHHPIPASGKFEQLLGGFMNELPETIAGQEDAEVEYAQKLMAQWQQIKEFLDERQASITPEENLVNSAAKEHIPASHKMMDRMEEMMAKHPRLSPLALPLAHQSIDEQADTVPNLGVFDQKNQLKDTILQQLNDWMYA